MRLLLRGFVVLIFATTGCRRPLDRAAAFVPDAGPPPAAPSSAVDASAADPRSLLERARAAYAAIRAGRLGEARRLLDSYEDDTSSRCWGSPHATALPNGGMRVTGPRGFVVTNRAGEIVEHEVVEGCLRRAEDGLRITSTETTIRIAGKDSSVELTRDDSGDPLGQHVFVSSSWALAVDKGGEYVALNRRDGRFLRGKHGADASASSHWMLPVGAALAEQWLVVDRGAQLSLVDAHGRSTDVRGCKGTLLAAQRTESGENALHVTTSAESTDTRVCLVKDDGTTRKVVPLRSATCGLREAMPCPYALQAATPRLLGFGSMRGGFVLVDVVGSRIVDVPLPTGAYADGLSPGGFFGCGSDELCVSYTSSSNGDTGVTAVRMNGNKLATRVLAKTPDPDDAWCALAGLPVPKVVCD